MAIAPQRSEIGIRRHFTTPGVHPYDEVRWERRDARITNFRDGSVAFEQLGVEVPEGWSVNATNILAQKYFRGTLGTEEREWSLKQVADRVVGHHHRLGPQGRLLRRRRGGRGLQRRAEVPHHPPEGGLQLPGVVQHRRRRACLSRPRRASSFRSTTRWTRSSTGTRRRGPSSRAAPGAGVNLSRIRSSKEGLQGGGTASGPVSFMRGRRRLGRDDQVAAARPAGRPRWSSSTSTTPTSRTSSGARPSRSARPGRCATPASTWTSTARTATPSSTRTPTTRSG